MMTIWGGGREREGEREGGGKEGEREGGGGREGVRKGRVRWEEGRRS